MIDSSTVATIVVLCTVLSMLFAMYYAWVVTSIPISAEADVGESSSLVQRNVSAEEINYDKLIEISAAIREGADAFLFQEYAILAVFIVIFSVVLMLLIGLGSQKDWTAAVFATVAFIVGACTSILSGYLGMKIATNSNSRVALMARFGYEHAFSTAFKAGAVMGFGLVGLGVLVLFVLVNVYSRHYDISNRENIKTMFETVAGYGLGGSSIALFGRVGGGIYTKAADVGADLSGKLEHGLEEDSPINPATIADNVGDNVGDIAGMGADLFGSLAEASCASMVVASQMCLDKACTTGVLPWTTLCFPMVIMSFGILVSMFTSFFATHWVPTKDETEIEPNLKLQLLISTILMTPVAYLVCYITLPDSMFYVTRAEVVGVSVITDSLEIQNWRVFICLACGLWSGLIIGYITEYFTSFSYQPVRDCADACKTGAATNIIYGLALGYKSCIIPVTCIAITIIVSHSLANMYGVSAAALGILSTLPTGLAIDGYGPICDNAGGLAEMCHMPAETRERTDALDAAGNTTAAIGKGFAIGSAAFVSLALFGAFVTSRGLASVDILKPFPFAGLLIGAMLPYWFSALTMRSVGEAAKAMVEEVDRQLLEPYIEAGTNLPKKRKTLVCLGQEKPDYARCVAISTTASLREMIAPGVLVIATPIIFGFLFGAECLAGVLAGCLTSGVQVAISASNSGGAWDNTKKYIAGVLKEKPSARHDAAVVGDTVGDPLKDTSGPSLNILIKLTAIISVVTASSMPTNEFGLFGQMVGL